MTRVYSIATISSQNIAMEAIIIGGGLVGYHLAIQLAQLGWRVKVFEKYRDPRKKRPECTRSINLTLSRRGEDGLESIGLLKTVLDSSVPAYGRVVYDKKDRETSRSMYGEKGESIGSIQRFALNLLLLDTADNMENIEVFFHQELITCDFEAGVITIRDTKDGQKVDKEFTADLIVGADGAHSALRGEMMKQRKLDLMEFKYHDHGYMEMFIPASSTGEYQMENNMLHVYPRDTFTLICLPNQGGTFSGTLVMPFSLFETAMSTPAALINFFRKQFPGVYKMVGEKGLISQFKPGQDDRRTPCRLVSLKCQPYHVSGVTKANFVLVGDAAHAMVPFYGQGMNTGFEDCLVLIDKLKQHGWQSQQSLASALEDFSATRCQDGQAMAQFSYEHYAALCHGVKGSNYSIRRHIDSFLYRWFPESWVPEYTMIAFSRKPFNQCQKECSRQDRILRWTLIITFIFIAIVICILVSLFV